MFVERRPFAHARSDCCAMAKSLAFQFCTARSQLKWTREGAAGEWAAKCPTRTTPACGDLSNRRRHRELD